MDGIFSKIEATVVAGMDNATVWAWSLPTGPQFKELPRQRLALCVHVLALVILTVGTFGLFHIATFHYLAYRIETTNLSDTPLYNPAVRHTALLLHADLCRQFAFKKLSSTPSLTDQQHALIMHLLSTITPLTTSFLDKNDTRSAFEKFYSFAQEYESTRAPMSREMLTRFSSTILPNLQQSFRASLFKQDKDGYYLSFDPLLPEQILQIYRAECRELGTLLGVWLSNPELVAYPLGCGFALNFYAGLLLSLEFHEDLDTPLDQLSKERQRQLARILSGDPSNPGALQTCQSRYAALQEVAKAFRQAYNGGIDAILRPEVDSACLVATLLQPQHNGDECGKQLIQVALSTPNLPEATKTKCQNLINGFKRHPEMLHSFLLTLNRVELEARRASLPLLYGKKSDLIRAIDEHPLSLNVSNE